MTHLIAHKVRGAPAFDIAEHLTCPLCESGCFECDDLGYWWVIPTSGHRAYPYWSQPLTDLGIDLLPDGNWAWGRTPEYTYEGLIGIPDDDWPDHYRIVQSPTQPKPKPGSLLAQLGFQRPTINLRRL